jgi:hypothetical protein
MLKYQINDIRISNIYVKIYSDVQGCSPRLVEIPALVEEFKKYKCDFTFDGGTWWLQFEREEDAILFLLLN